MEKRREMQSENWNLSFAFNTLDISEPCFLLHHLSFWLLLSTLRLINPNISPTKQFSSISKTLCLLSSLPGIATFQMTWLPHLVIWLSQRTSLYILTHTDGFTSRLATVLLILLTGCVFFVVINTHTHTQIFIYLCSLLGQTLRGSLILIKHLGLCLARRGVGSCDTSMLNWMNG